MIKNQKIRSSATQPLKLDGTRNTRDIGGYLNFSGTLTKDHQFLRSDGLSTLSESDVNILLEYGVKCVIDLRSESEKIRDKESVDLLNSVDYFSVPMLDQAASSNFAENMPKSMGLVYVDLLKNNGEDFVKILNIIDNYLNDVVLFHCSAGKDRTGITAMLLLLLAGVSKEQIIVDYSSSYENMKDKFMLQRQILENNYGIKVPDYVFSSAPEEIQLALNYLDDNFHSIDDYFLSNGVSSIILHNIRKKLI